MKITPLIAVFCLFGISVAFADTAKAPVTVTVPTATSTVAVEVREKTIEEKVLETFGDKRMLPVVSCESGFRQYDKNGNPLKSPTGDVGVGQVNQVHWSRAEELGLDIFNNVDDNLAMAKIIYDEQGIEAWTVYGGKCYNEYLKTI